MKVSEEFPSYFLSGDEISGKEVPVVIKEVKKETVPTKQGKQEEVIAIYFEDKKRGVRLNRTRAKEISRLYGDDMDAWKGKSVLLFTRQQRAFGDVHNVIHMKGPDETGDNEFPTIQADSDFPEMQTEPTDEINIEDIPL